MPRYKLSLFGGFSLQDESGEAVPVVSKKGRCLLACLAMAQGQSLQRGYLTNLLWGDRDEAHARHSVSQALYRLRGLFPEQIQTGFNLSADTIGLVSDVFDVDVLRFEARLNDPSPDAAEAALALYTGELLVGLELGQEGFDEWLRIERERLRERAIVAFRDLLRTRMSGPAERAIETALRLLAIDPANEETHRALMRLYARTGRRDLAARQYDKCKKILWAELGIEPDQETQTLRERIEAEASPAPSPQRSAPAQLLAEAPSSPSSPETVAHTAATQAERRQVTVLQWDLVIAGSSAEPLDPEDRREIVQAAREACADIVRRYDGTMMKPLGDGFLACFGFPLAHEDDAPRAAHVGLDIVEAVAQLKHPEVRSAARVGIATGLVIAGDSADGIPSEDQALSGEAPNLASRLQHIAERGSVVVSESTSRLLDAGFELEELEPHAPAGVPNSVQAWRVMAHHPVESRFEATHPGRLTAFVGREDELEMISRRWRRASSGEGQVVLISGEPGIGKSRLTQIVHERLGDEPHTRLRYQCSPHHVNSALYPISTQLEFAACIAASDSAAQKLDKLEVLLGQASDEVGAFAPLLAHLLSIPHEGRYPPLNLTPQARKARTLEALNDQLIGLARKRPVLMVFEDLHWVDPTTQEALDLMVDRIRNARVLALLTFRPEYQAPWVGQPHVHFMALNRLTRRESIQLVRNVAADESLDEETMAEVAGKADGVPLFMEELTRVLLEGSSREAIPTTLHASLLARFDRLGPAKEVAQLGAVIGREFRRDLLAAVAPIGGQALEEALERLVGSELVFARGAPPEATYSFKHALIQDAAYESLLKGRRRGLHAKVAEALRTLFPELEASQPELLAHHYGEAGLADLAIRYWERAGNRALERSANIEAIRHFRAGVAQLSGIAEAERPAKELSLQIGLGSALTSIEGYAAAATGAAYRRARELCIELGDDESMFPVLYGLWNFDIVGGRLAQALAKAREILSQAQRSKSEAARLVAHSAIGTVLNFMGRWPEGHDNCETCVKLYDPNLHAPLRFEYTEDLCVQARISNAICLWNLGYPQRALLEIHHSVSLAETLRHANSTGYALTGQSMLNFFSRDPRAALTASEAAIEFTRQAGMKMYGCPPRVFRGWALAQLGDIDKGLAEIRSGIDGWRAAGSGVILTWFFAALGDAFRAAGKFEESMEAIDEGIGYVEKNDERSREAELLRLRGEVTLVMARGSFTEAESSFARALEVAQNQQAKSMELRVATSRARLWRDQGKRQEARELLAPVYDWFTEGFDTPDLKEAKALQDELA